MRDSALQLLKENTEQGHEIVVVAEAATFAGVGRAMVAAEGTAEGIDENGGAMVREKVVVAVGCIVATGNLGGETALVVDVLQQVDKGRGLTAVGVYNHEAFVATTEKVDIDKELYLGKVDQRIVDKVA